MRSRLRLFLAAFALVPLAPSSARADAASGVPFPHPLSTYETTYILPAYYTFAPDNAVYGNTLPDNQNLNSMEVKFQISFKAALASQGALKDVYLAYTQNSFWQLYRDSAFFRETDYQPELLIIPEYRRGLGAGWELGFHAVPYAHQSNGRGGTLERSWDRTFAEAIFERSDDARGDRWTVRLRPWIVWRDTAYRRYNPDLARYLGYGREAVSYQRGPWEVTLGLQNQVESGFHRGSVEATVSRFIGTNWSLYVQYFDGFGQSLIEYNHATSALGAGFALRTR